MSQGLLIALVVAFAVGCPLHMWWMNRRGKRPACCPPEKEQPPRDLAALRARRGELEAQLAEFDLGDGDERVAPPPPIHR